jgi:hypothetical protein
VAFSLLALGVLAKIGYGTHKLKVFKVIKFVKWMQECEFAL